MAATGLAVVVQPPGRGEHIARTLRLYGYRVAVHHDLESASRRLSRVASVSLLFVDHGGGAFAGNDLLSRVDDFRSLRHARVVITLPKRSSVFAEALRARGAELLFHPVDSEDVAAIALGEPPGSRKWRWAATKDESRRLRSESRSLRARVHETVARARRLRRVIGQGLGS